MKGQLETALRFSLASQARNRLAAILLVAFVPSWYLLIGAMIPDAPLSFRLRATGVVLSVNGHDLGLITAGLNTVTIIAGFTVLAATRRSRAFDRRLIIAGYNPAALIGSKVLTALTVAACVGSYATVIMLAFWRPTGIEFIWLAFALGAATYAALGLLIGVLVPGDLEGFFLIIMISLVDTFLQNPVQNPLANKPVLSWFPAYAPMQLSVGGAFRQQLLGFMAALSLVWTVGFAAAALVILVMRNPGRSHVTGR